MHPDLQNLPDKLNAEQKLVHDTIHQIKKDFVSNGLELQLDWKAGMQYQNLVNELAASLDWLFENDRPRLMQLLYRIDLPEFKLAALLSDENEHALSIALADLIVRREAQKVIIRNFYSTRTH
ncbi:MAG: hypothetical protein ACK417_07125 [Bacteroidia bacterium]